MLLSVGTHELNVYVARSREERATGLMHCTRLAEDEGMLFMSGQPAVQSFWMKDTPLALSAAFLEEDGTIVHLCDMRPHSLDSHGCEVPVRFVLEVRQGWFAERGIGVGARLRGPAFLTG